MWTPPEAEATAVAAELRAHGARPWQIELTTPLIVDAIASVEPAAEYALPRAESSHAD